MTLRTLDHATTGPCPRLARLVSRPGAAVLLIGLVALAVRVGLVLRAGVISGTFGYDSGVYFAGADAFLHGRSPYEDFVLLHPPVLMCALTPFASLAGVIGDSAAFTVTLFAFAVLGAVNACLVVAVARALGLDRRATLLGGAFYAVWEGAAGAEYLIKLEALSNTLFLLGALALVRARRARSAVATALAGVPLGVFATVKIWCVVPAVLVLAWFVLTSANRRRAGAAVAGAAAGCAAVDLPFFVADPRSMWTSVVVDQLGRHPNRFDVTGRLADLSTVPRLLTTTPVTVQLLAAAGFVVLVAGVARRAWRLRPLGRPVVVLLVVQLVVLLVSPSWFVPYCAYVAVPLSLTVAVAAAAPARRHVPSVALVVLAVSSAVVTLLVAVSPAPGGGVVRDAPALSAAVADRRCVMSDTPILLIRLNVLSRDLAAGCRNWIDVTGRTYGIDRASASRPHNVRWQRDLERYLTSGDAVLIGRANGDGLTTRTLRAVHRGGVLARVDGRTVWRTPGSGAGHPTPVARARRSGTR